MAFLLLLAPLTVARSHSSEELDELLLRGGELEQRAHELEAAVATFGAVADDRALVLQAKAHAVYRAAIALAPNDAAAYYHLGHALRAGGHMRRTEVLSLFEAALNLDPGNSAARTSLAYALIADDDAAQRRRGLEVLAHGVAMGVWPQSETMWQHPMEQLPTATVPPPSSPILERAPFDCVLRQLEAAAASMGAEAAAVRNMNGGQHR